MEIDMTWNNERGEITNRCIVLTTKLKPESVTLVAMEPDPVIMESVVMLSTTESVSGIKTRVRCDIRHAECCPKFATFLYQMMNGEGCTSDCHR